MREPSIAEVRSARINPRSSEEEKYANEIIVSLIKEGYTFKDIVVDAICRSKGKTPEMFARTKIQEAPVLTAEVIMPNLHEMLEGFAKHIIKEIREGHIGHGLLSSQPDDWNQSEDTAPETSEYLRNMAKSYTDRYNTQDEEED